GQEVQTMTNGHQLVWVYFDTTNQGYYAAQLNGISNALTTSPTPLTACLMHQFDDFGPATGFVFQDCVDSSLEDCRVLSMHQGVTRENGRNHTATNVFIGPKKSNWVVGANRGGYGGVYGVAGNLHFDHVDVVGAFDDCLDLTGCVWARVETIG